MSVPLTLATPNVALHVFDLAELRSERAEFEAEASPDERARAARLRDPEHRERFVLRRGALRRLLATETGTSAREVRFVAGYGGKPLLADAGPCFSPSSSGNVFVVALSTTHEVGLDVERILPHTDLDDVARHFFPIAVGERLRAPPDGVRLAAFLRVWTLEEAVGKLDGRGIAEGTPLADVPLDALTHDGRWPLPTEGTLGPRFVETRALGNGAVLSLATAPRVATAPVSS